MGLESDLREFIKDTAEIYHDTGMPMLPCVLHHFCLPFSPACAACYFVGRRKSKLEDLVKDFNEDKALEKGIYIEWNSDYYAALQPQPRVRGRRRQQVLVPVYNPGLNVKMNVVKRQEYCARHGMPFVMPQFSGPVTEAPYSAGGFCLPPSNNADHLPMEQKKHSRSSSSSSSSSND